MSARRESVKKDLQKAAPARRKTAKDPEHRCTVPVGTYFVEVQNEDVGKVKRYRYCDHEAAHVPIVTFRGREVVRIFNKRTGKTTERRMGEPEKMPVQLGPVCDEHKVAITKNPRILLTADFMRSQQKTMADAGHPLAEPKLTRLGFVPFVPPQPVTESEALDHLVRIAGGEAEEAETRDELEEEEEILE